MGSRRTGDWTEGLRTRDGTVGAGQGRGRTGGWGVVRQEGRTGGGIRGQDWGQDQGQHKQRSAAPRLEGLLERLP